MCMSSPKPPALPENPVEQRQKEADKKEKETKDRLAKRKGGRQFLNSDRGFKGLGGGTLLDDKSKLGSSVPKL